MLITEAGKEATLVQVSVLNVCAPSVRSSQRPPRWRLQGSAPARGQGLMSALWSKTSVSSADIIWELHAGAQRADSQPFYFVHWTSTFDFRLKVPSQFPLTSPRWISGLSSASLETLRICGGNTARGSAHRRGRGKRRRGLRASRVAAVPP